MLNIYFVEDDAAIRESIIRNVKWEQHGYELVGQAPDGEIAYSELQTLRPDVLITDLKMPFMNGLELSRLVRKEMPEVKIIVLTGYNDFESVQEALNIGVAKYLLKPVTPEALVEAITDMRDLIMEDRVDRSYREKYLNDMSKLQDLKIDRIAVERFLRNGTPNDVEPFVDMLLEAVNKQKAHSYLLLQYIVMDTYFVVTEFLDRIGVSDSLAAECSDKLKLQSSELTTIVSARRYLIELISTAAHLRNETALKRQDSYVEKAQSYIRDNFSNDEISLNTVAKHVGLSSAHFSTVFSQETGKTFTEFLTELRMEKASDLLLYSPKRSSEIAYEVGYRDPQYFSYAFKKFYGCSPREYRVGGNG